MPNYCHCDNCEDSGIYHCLGCNGFHQQWKHKPITQESKSDP